ncbi:uncharacterized protein LOC120774318 isoform X1 [Bactrocera tryoni]|uniref:uncharacterized protein LOC120774318 isoform X1 n=1 Tax=Bactrocera tryoni TaxID=59916 RepID=UPI001A98C64B|nr:uncharacterized protein LOC120774318 isoform X1 [Bactrocera tryoni]
MFAPCKAPWCRLAIWLIVSVIVLLLVLVLIALAIFGSHPCAGALDGCDAFKAICASYNGDHQFFYSHCDMLRENCLTGSVFRQASNDLMNPIHLTYEREVHREKNIKFCTVIALL